MSKQLKQTGIASSTQIGKGGTRLASDGIVSQTRTPDNSALARHQGAPGVGPDDFATLSQVSSGYNEVTQLSDLPAPVSGVRTLPAGTATRICGTITLPAGERIVVPSDSVLTGRDAALDGIVGDVAAPLIAGAGDGLVVKDLFLRNPNLDPAAYCVYVTNGFNPVGRASRVENVSIGGTGGVLVEDATSVLLILLSRCTRDGVVLAGQTRGTIVENCVFLADAGSNADNFVFDGGTHTAVRLSAGFFQILNNSVGILARNTPTLSFVRVGSTDFLVTPGGSPGVVVSGNIAPGVAFGPDGQSDVMFLSNFGIADSSFSGAMAIATNTTQITDILSAGQSVFVRVGSGNASHPPYTALNPTSRFAVTGAQTQNQALVYTGPEPITATVTANASIRQNNIYQLQAAMRIVHVPVSTGIPVPQTTFTGVLADGYSGIGATGEITATAPRLSLEPGDQLYVEIANNTDTIGNPLTNLVVSSITLSFSE